MERRMFGERRQLFVEPRMFGERRMSVERRPLVERWRLWGRKRRRRPHRSPTLARPGTTVRPAGTSRPAERRHPVLAATPPPAEQWHPAVASHVESTGHPAVYIGSTGQPAVGGYAVGNPAVGGYVGSGHDLGLLPPRRSGRRGARGRRPDPRFGGLPEALRSRLPGPGRAAAIRREMEEAVPEVVDVIRATVAAGVNPRRALQAAAEAAPSALEGILGQAIRTAELGAGAGAALATAARAEGLGDLALAGEALDLAETTGAPPGPVLAGVAIAAADRVRSRQAMLAATAQARLSARVVAAMAPAFLGVLALTSPSDAAFLIREPAGWATLAGAATLELLGIAWATHIVRGPTP